MQHTSVLTLRRPLARGPRVGGATAIFPTVCVVVVVQVSSHDLHCRRWLCPVVKALGWQQNRQAGSKCMHGLFFCTRACTAGHQTWAKPGCGFSSVMEVWILLRRDKQDQTLLKPTCWRRMRAIDTPVFFTLSAISRTRR